MPAINSRRLLRTIGAHLVVLVALQLVLVAGLIVYTGSRDFHAARQEAEHHLATTAQLAVEEISDQLTSSSRWLREAARFNELLESRALCTFAQPDAALRGDHTVRTYPILLHADGSPFCPPAPNTPNASLYKDVAWFKRTRASSRPTIAGPLIDPVTDDYVVTYATKVPADGSILGIAVDMTSVVPVLDKLHGSSRPAPSFLLATKDRSTLLSKTDGVGGFSLAGTPFVRPVTRETNTFKGLDDVERIYAEAEVLGFGWHLYAGVSTADAFAVAHRTVRQLVMFALGLGLIVLAVAFVMQRRFVRPIRSLAQVTKKISGGDFSANVVPSGPVELAELGESFNSMTAARADAEAALRTAYEAEQRAAEEFRAVAEMRNSFLMAISHELRTPLTSVVGYSMFLSEAGDDVSKDELEQSIKAISTQSKRLERILLDLLDVERLSRGIVQPNLRETNVRDVVMHVVEQASANSRIRAVLKGPVRSYVDPALVERIVENLVVNAIKHTPADAKIWVRATRRNGHLELAVEDAGDGVPDDLKLAIFEPFKQGRVPRHSPGTGVGLSLVSQFAKLHGGRAWVEDRAGGGASFRVVLPATEPKCKRGRTTAELRSV